MPQHAIHELTKGRLRKSAPNLYGFLANCKRTTARIRNSCIRRVVAVLDSILARRNPAFARRLIYKSNARRLDKYFRKKYGVQDRAVFEMGARDAPVGFFSLVFQALGAIDFCRRNNCEIIINYDSGCYIDSEIGPNWWQYYFENNKFDFRSKFNESRAIRLDHREREMFAILGGTLDAALAHQLITEIGLKDWILGKVSKYEQQYFSDRHVIGIHYRGTDKVIGQFAESGRVPPKGFINYLSGNFANDTFFFVATDEESFLNDMKSNFSSRVLHYDSLRSKDSSPLHYGNSSSSGFKLGEDALIDCLLLSRCREIVRTTSNLSHACRFFNPKLKVTDLTKGIAPEKIVFSAEMGRVHLP
jgi:hypothetical protein